MDEHRKASLDNAKGLVFMLLAARAQLLLDEQAGPLGVSLYVAEDWVGVQGLPEDFETENNMAWARFTSYATQLQNQFAVIHGLVIVVYEVGAIMTHYWQRNRELPFNMDEILHDKLKDMGLE
jgi:hypothetical protein